MARPPKILVTTTLLACALMAGLLACRGVPARPASVSQEAMWCPESKEGIFLKVGGHQGTLWQLEIWDRQGRALASGSFRLRGFAKAKIVPEEVVSWQNGVLQLKDGTVLVQEAPAAP
ncbi:MAG TPA: hypothetical protein VJ528_12655 [Geothrix sp.]|uniref:hypothetical protein n=1 Tax=Geothrix mesophila TaxID=2922723 RepID=UPI001FAE0A68|nr:hypothetical protein [Geothrix sp. SG198]HJV39680.1 hypothetical protein [Geothrix sp.]